jgi:nucleoside-triphosphatase THEP1
MMQEHETITKFPPELLCASEADKIAYFNNYIIQHNFLKRAVTEVMNVLKSPISERLIFVCGPSGVGKKELIRAIEKEITDHYKGKINPGCIPCVAVEAKSTDKGGFNFPNLWRDILIHLNEPLIDKKIHYEEQRERDALGRTVLLFKIHKGDLGEVLQNALKYREVKALIIDEAHNMLKVTSSQRVNWSIDLLKTLTNCSQTPIVLVGTYELLTFLDDLDKGITDQINRRAKIIHFPRYSELSDEDIITFGNIAKRLLLNMPLKRTSENLVDEDWHYFHRATLGCIGTLKIWLVDALSLALYSGDETLSKECLENTKIIARSRDGMKVSLKRLCVTRRC